jgi:hypothetical protein
MAAQTLSVLWPTLQLNTKTNAKLRFQLLQVPYPYVVSEYRTGTHPCSIWKKIVLTFFVSLLSLHTGNQTVQLYLSCLHKVSKYFRGETVPLKLC